MSEWKNAKADYEKTELPEELERRVRTGAAEGRRRAARRTKFRAMGSMAACMGVLVLSLNLFPAFAAAAADVPVIGGLFRVMTVRSFAQHTDGGSVTVDQPGVSANTDFAVRVNEEIARRVDEKVAEGNRVVAEYKEAFLATGGTEEQWAARPESEVSVTYEIKSQTDTTVSFVVDYFVSVASAYSEQYFYNLDVVGDRELTLADVLGADWVEQCNQSIAEQMAAHPQTEDFFTPAEGGFTTVDEATAFYLDGQGRPVVVFPKYAVAPGSFGAVEFPIG